MTAIHNTPTEEVNPDQSETDEAADKPQSWATPGRLAAIITVGGIALIFLISFLITAFMEPQLEAELRVTQVNATTSDAGRVEVNFTVVNEGEGSERPSCWVRAEDADGFRLGSDLVNADYPIAPGDRERYTAITGIKANGVALVTVEC